MVIKKYIFRKEVGIIFFVIILAILKDCYDNKVFKNKGGYVLGEITKTGYGSTGNYCNYRYFYNGKSYTQDGNIGYNKIPNKGDYFLVILKKEIIL